MSQTRTQKESNYAVLARFVNEGYDIDIEVQDFRKPGELLNDENTKFMLCRDCMTFQGSDRSIGIFFDNTFRCDDFYPAEKQMREEARKE